MANWDNITERGSVEDLRGSSFGTMAGVGGLGTIVAFAIMLMGGNADIANMIGGAVDTYAPRTQVTTREVNDPTNYQDFAAKVVGSADKVFSEQLTAAGKNYQKPTLTLFRQYAPSGCGGARSEYGPHYCPLDKKVYLDETFFQELSARFGAADSKVTQAYVIAHEMGHHVQKVLNIIDTNTNAEQINVELQADCLAGVWAGNAQSEGILAPEDFKDAVSAAESVGDDHIQKTAGQRVNPESWTHGSSAQRVEALETGYNSKNIQTCLEKY